MKRKTTKSSVFLGLLGSIPSSGTLTPRSGTEKVCAAVAGSIARVVLPFTVMAPPTVPRTRPWYGLRRPLALSCWSMVTRPLRSAAP